MFLLKRYGIASITLRSLDKNYLMCFMVFQYQNLTLKVTNEMEQLNPKPLILLLRKKKAFMKPRTDTKIISLLFTTTNENVHF